MGSRKRSFASALIVPVGAGGNGDQKPDSCKTLSVDGSFWVALLWSTAPVRSRGGFPLVKPIPQSPRVVRSRLEQIVLLGCVGG